MVIYCLRIVHLMHQKNKLDYYRNKDCAKMFCKDSRKHAVKIIGCGKKEMVSLTIKMKINNYINK